MKKPFVLLTLTLSTFALGSTWDVDPDHTSANFVIRHMMVTNVHGRLGKVTGTVELEDKDLTKSKVDVSIDVAGIDTNVPRRDDHLRSDAFFDVTKFATVTFKSTKIEKAGKALKVTGDLTMHGVTKPVTLDAELSDEVMGKVPLRAVGASTTINREDWGLTWNKQVPAGVLVGKEVKIELEIELLKKVPAAPPAPAPKK